MEVPYLGLRQIRVINYTLENIVVITFANELNNIKIWLNNKINVVLKLCFCHYILLNEINENIAI